MQPNWRNRTMWTGDNLDIMRGMNSETVDLIYLLTGVSNTLFLHGAGRRAGGAVQGGRPCLGPQGFA